MKIKREDIEKHIDNDCQYIQIINVDICHTNHCDENTRSCYQIADTCNDGNNNTIVVVVHMVVSTHQSCTVDFCDFRGYCYHYETRCSDYDACTLDTCGEKGYPCTADFCSMLYGCYHKPIECSVKVPCSTDSQCNRNTYDYYGRDRGGSPCINNEWRTGTITN
ncbi:hypothetical protein DDB_G0291053 [Dictyostelium discoideum AX4]|uniref:Uncharacterized protein n=1 Tax=Dictyostelium discoideum TaxID=44689 RepID=Q54FB3_DICDI|nr:hypothetical protein DDB_G0291053 [Dictyostelium discoideum AX4]EAL61957.1 hypothetical protein DDB_G0291053 [Dictyostelium discoideum AX4]|eukprot:XP_635424.1 hypothetical protein DDB_G0291053 [Dictyostelium discoideum AX4]